MAQKLWPTMVVVLLVAGAAPRGQSARLKSSEVSAFLGTWVITMTNPPGAQETVRIVDKDGIIVASVQLGRFPPSDVTGIVKDGDLLVLTTRRLENGQPIWVVMSLTLEGDTMNMAQMLALSQTIKRGSGKKQQG
ncbi:MAG: hypothetical protein ACRD2N_08670 [Vicinamibacterales bacterium]